MWIEIKTSVRPPPSEWSIPPKKWPLWQSKSLIELKNFRIPILIPLVQSKSCELSSLRYHMGGSPKQQLCWFRRILFLNCPMLNQLQTGAKSLLVSMENGHPLLPYVHHGYGTKQLINWSDLQEITFSAVNINSYQLRIDDICDMCLKIPTQNQCFERKKRWFLGSQKFEI